MLSGSDENGRGLRVPCVERKQAGMDPGGVPAGTSGRWVGLNGRFRAYESEEVKGAHSSPLRLKD